MDSTSREMIGQFEDSLINTIRKALVDESAEVRQAASLSFENLHNTIGHRALDGVLPEVFKKLVRWKKFFFSNGEDQCDFGVLQSSYCNCPNLEMKKFGEIKFNQ